MPTSTKPAKLTLADVDGTRPGVAALLTIDLSQGWDAKAMHQVVAESPETPNPHRTAERLWESIKDDWPGWTHTVVVDERARFLMMDGRMQAMGFEPSDPQEYVDERNRERRA